MSKYHEEYSLRHKVEFRPDEFADDPRTFAHPAIRIICAPNRYGIGDEQTWHRSQTPMPNHAHLPLYVIDHSAVHISLTPFAGAGPDAWQIGVVDIDIFAFAGSSEAMLKAVNDAVEDYDAWINGEVYTLVYRERGTNVPIKKDEGVYGYVIAVHKLEWRDTTVVPAPTTYSLRPPVITSEDVADMLGMTVAQAEEFLLDNSTRIIQRMVASAWSAIADIKRSM